MVNNKIERYFVSPKIYKMVIKDFGTYSTNKKIKIFNIDGVEAYCFNNVFYTDFKKIKEKREANIFDNFDDKEFENVFN